MKITKLKLRENLEIFGIDENGNEHRTIVAIPPNEGKSRLDIIADKDLVKGYNFDNGDHIIVIQVGRFAEENKILWHPHDVYTI